jgi:thymidylate synthase ThyX
MTITAKVIADSIADGCPRITTMQLRYPRFIHSEFMTHRVFSRNASSSRAIPVERMIQDVIDDPAMPVHWGAEQKGMQAGEELPRGEYAWMAARDEAVYNAQLLAAAGYHKQIVNRILEPFQHINVLVTATEWDNFFALRDHPDAQPEIQALARAMREAMAGSEPDHLSDNEWHTPYVGRNGDKRVSSACCASTSYKTVDGKPMTAERALRVFDKLTGDPLHASPFEQIARPDPDNGPGCRNFTKWHQWRADLEDK